MLSRIRELYNMGKKKVKQMAEEIEVTDELQKEHNEVTNEPEREQETVEEIQDGPSDVPTPTSPYFPSHDEMVLSLGKMDDEEFAATHKAVTEAHSIRTQKQEQEAAEVAGDAAKAQHGTDENVRQQAPAHDHKFKRGILPGGKYIKTCSVCGTTQDVTFEEWQVLG